MFFLIRLHTVYYISDQPLSLIECHLSNSFIHLNSAFCVLQNYGPRYSIWVADTHNTPIIAYKRSVPNELTLLKATITILTRQSTTVACQVQTCAPNCEVLVYNGGRLHWTAKSFSTTIVAATVVQIINTDLHSTSLSTQYNEIPAGYTVPTNTNAQGTQTVDIIYFRSDQRFTTTL